jgi:hypothetical protein
MLLSSGTGSYFSKRLLQSDPKKLGSVLACIFVIVCLLSSIITPISESGVALPFPLKVLITVLLISPVGFIMGMPFPTGLGMLQTIMPASVRWAWSINAASSVMGSAGAMFLAIYLGLQLTLIVGGVFYLGAWASLVASPLARHRASSLLAA